MDATESLDVAAINVCRGCSARATCSASDPAASPSNVASNPAGLPKYFTPPFSIKTTRSAIATAYTIATYSHSGSADFLKVGVK